MASERKERRHLTTLELDDLAWSVRRFEEQSKRDGNKKRDCDRAQRLRVLLGKLDNALIPTERRAMASEQVTIGNDGLEWPQTWDGMAWAVEFNKQFPSVAVDEALGWFCNAIMRGYDVATGKHERIDRALRFAAGMISTTGEWASKHPEECYDWLMAQTDTNPGASRDGE